MTRAAGVLVLGLLLAGCSTSTADPSDPPPTGSVDGSMRSSWDAVAAAVPFTTTRPYEVTNPVVVGDRVVVLGEQEASGYDAGTGAISWTARFSEPVCAGSRTGNQAGVLSVLLSDDPLGGGHCTHAVALDTTTGTVLWTVPIPRTEEAFGAETAVGATTVVVGGECAGFSLLSLADGSVVKTVTGETADGICASEASDGTSVVSLTERLRFEVRDAGTGAISGSWPVGGRGRVGDVLARDPLVVTVRLDSEAHLLDLTGTKPRAFGRDRGDFGGEVAAWVRVGDVLWVQYDDVDELVGYDLATLEEAATVPVGRDTRLLGAYDGSLVVMRYSGLSTTELLLVDPAGPGDPQVVGVLPAGTADDSGVAGIVLAGDHVVRLWKVGLSENRLEAFELP